MRSAYVHAVLGRARSRLVPALGAMLLAACAGAPGGTSIATEELSESADGLRRVEIDMPGRLFVREDHGVGTYDAFLIPEASISYTRSSRRFPEGMEEAFLASLEQSLIDAAEEAEIPIVQTPGSCVLQVGMALVGVQVERASSTTLGRMTLVMEFRDTLSGEPLLRYATQQEIQREGTGVPRGEQFRHAFDEMVDEMEISGPLRAAGLGATEIRPGCRGLLAQRGQGGKAAVSTAPE